MQENNTKELKWAWSPSPNNYRDVLLRSLDADNLPASAEELKPYVDAGFDVNGQTGKRGNPPLVRAVYANNLAFAQALLELGANPNILSEHGIPPLLRAVSRMGVKWTKLLVKYGADTNICDKEGSNCLSRAMARSEPSPPILVALLDGGVVFDSDKGLLSLGELAANSAYRQEDEKHSAHRAWRLVLGHKLVQHALHNTPDFSQRLIEGFKNSSRGRYLSEEKQRAIIAPLEVSLIKESVKPRSRHRDECAMGL